MLNKLIVIVIVSEKFKKPLTVIVTVTEEP